MLLYNEKNANPGQIDLGFFVLTGNRMDRSMSYQILPISHSLQETIANYTLADPLGFGQHLAPAVVSCHYRNGCWDQPSVGLLQNLSFPMHSKILHYGQQIFEGMKAYRGRDGVPRLFRPEQNLARFQASAKRMAMPSIDAETFLGSLASLVCHLQDLIPNGEGESLYLRPLMIALDCGMSQSTSENYLFYILASPSGAYFNTSRVRALIEREDCRAAPGGTGAVKTAGNYGASIRSSILAKQMGFQQTLWLDALQHRLIEEFSGMNFFAVIDDELVTPALCDTILPGVTRDTLIQLAKFEGIKVAESAMLIDELLASIEAGRCSEVFACGTAAVISPIAELGEKDGRCYPLANAYGPIAKKLRTRLLSIQSGQGEDPGQWSVQLTASGNQLVMQTQEWSGK